MERDFKAMRDKENEIQMKPGYMDVVEANDEEINVNGKTKMVVAKVNDVYPRILSFLNLVWDDMTKLACLHDLGFS
ncbi:hypothetical protein Bca52824_023565 [Brassica carinata]|uniref:Uncharacterized protein n=1 Tax=Brassica carinata TaxID=52824 RepID=A0A8X8AUR6_BRACI|nr:hypothetical protein Bca52824_023565 [Brassica carinata]